MGPKVPASWVFPGPPPARWSLAGSPAEWVMVACRWPVPLCFQVLSLVGDCSSCVASVMLATETRDSVYPVSVCQACPSRPSAGR